MTPSIEVITLSGSNEARPVWDHGPQRTVAATPKGVHEALAASAGDAVLCLDAAFPHPDPKLLARLLEGPADAWHAGLRLGLDGQPRWFDHVNPLWMLNCAADPSIETTSWRISLRALLVRAEVLHQLGGPDADLDTLSGAGLELGLRWIRSGALIRHVPDLAPLRAPSEPPPSTADALSMIARHQSRLWAGWALKRAVATSEVRVVGAARLLWGVRHARPKPPVHYRPSQQLSGHTNREVSVIIPTLDRYAYLKPLLRQLATQTTAPTEVIVADQTPRHRRRTDLTDVAPDLPVTVIDMAAPGQSTARNACLGAATGELLLFLDDDDEIGPDLIAGHLRLLGDGIDASCGAVDDATAGPPPEGFQHRRVSDVFPTNNTMLRRDALVRSGLFDPAYDHGPRADHDLGMRLHLAGALLVYDPLVEVFHHHASIGGLRVHGARRITRAGSRRSLTERNLPAVTELYLGLRYFTDRQNHEADLIRRISLLSGDGARARRLARAVIQVALLPSSIVKLRRARTQARGFLEERPVIPHLGPAPQPDHGAA